MTWISKIKAFLAGKKTYLTALAGIVAAVLGWTQGEIDDPAFIAALWAAIMAVFMRAGVAKTE